MLFGRVFGQCLGRLGISLAAVCGFALSDAQPSVLGMQLVNPIIAAGNGASKSPAISNNGQFIVFVSTATNVSANGGAGLMVVDTEGGTVENLFPGADGTFSDCDISDDGRYVAFTSTATNLVAADTNGVADIFVLDRLTSIVKLASVAGSGVQANQASGDVSISGNGQVVAFRSNATNLYPGDANAVSDVFVTHWPSRSIQRASNNISGLSAANGTSDSAQVSGDGNWVVYRSSASDIVAGDNNTASDIFLYNRAIRVNMCVSKTALAFGNGPSTGPSVSSDGEVVAFRTSATNLDNNSVADHPVLFNRTPSTFLTVQNQSGEKPNAGGIVGNRAKISPNGNYLCFDSTANNLFPNPSNQRLLLVWRVADKSFLLCNKTHQGDIGDVGAGAFDLADAFHWVVFESSSAFWGTNLNQTQVVIGEEGYQGSLLSRAYLQAKGGGVLGGGYGQVPVYSSKTDLVPGYGSNGKAQVISHDTGLSTQRYLSIYSGSSIPADADATIADVSPSGSKVAFYSTATNLQGSDNSGQIRLYIYDFYTNKTTIVPITDPHADQRARFSADETYLFFVTKSATSYKAVAYNLASGSSLTASGTISPSVNSVQYIPAGGSAGFILVRTSFSGLTLFLPTPGGAPSPLATLVNPGNTYYGSADGRRLYFLTTNGYSAGDTNGTNDVYAYDRVTNSFSLVVKNGGAIGGVTDFRLAGNGARIAFSTKSDPFGAAGSVTNVYTFDLATREFLRVSVKEDGGAITDDATLVAIDPYGLNLLWTTAANGVAPRTASSSAIGLYDATLSMPSTDSPDLSVESIDWSNVAVDAGNQLSTLAGIKNVAAVTAIGPWTYNYTLKRSGSGDSPTELVAKSFVNDLAGGETAQLTQAINLPKSLFAVRGQYDLTINLDVAGQIDPGLTTNNSVTGVIRVRAPDLDLALTQADFIPGSTSVRAGATITNIGDANAPTDIAADFYLSKDNQLDATDKLLGTLKTTVPLAPQASTNLLFDFALDELPDQGTYFLFAVVDPTNTVDLSGERLNNKASKTFEVVGPDLTITTASVPAISDSGRQVNITWTEKNLGLVSTKYGYSSEIRLNDQIVGTVSTSEKLAAGATINRSTSITIPRSLARGTYPVKVTVDSTNAVDAPENRGNNQFTANTKVVAPDLSLGQLVMPDSISVDATLNVSAPTTNIGDGTAFAPWQTRATFLSGAQSLKTVAGTDGIGNLFASASGQSTLSFTSMRSFVPARGNYSVRFETDTVSQVDFDSERGNNTAERSVQILAADLSALNLTGESNLITDKPTVIRWTDRNVGTFTNSANWSDKVFLSKDPALDGTDTLLADFAATKSLAPNTGLDRIQSIAVPTVSFGQDGAYFLLVVTDSNNQVDLVGDRGNNIATLPVHVTRRPLPDLIVDSITVPHAQTGFDAYSNTTIPVEWVVRNVGQASTALVTWRDYIFLTSDDALDPSDQLLSVENASYLPVDGGYIGRGSVLLPRDRAGDLKIAVYTDFDGRGFPVWPPTVWPIISVVETDESNNTKYTPIKIGLSPFPDLQVTRVRIPDTAFAGQSFPVTYTVANKGNSSIPPNERSWNDRIYLSTDKVLDGGDSLIATRPVARNLNIDETYDTIDFGTSVPPQMPEGEYYVLVKTDADLNVWEFDKDDNNVGVSSADGVDKKILIKASPPDMVVTNVTVNPTTTRSSDLIDIEFTVKNVGAFPVQLGFVDSVYLSNDQILDTQDLTLTELSGNSPLESQQEYTRTVQARLPGLISGAKYILVKTDSRNNVQEFDPSHDAEANNLGTPVAIQITEAIPNLVPTNLIGPGAANAGAPVTLSWKISNTGSRETLQSTWYDAVDLVPMNGQTGSYRLATVTRLGALAIGQSYSPSITVNLPITASGQYRLRLIADAANQVPEGSGETDNILDGGTIDITGQTQNVCDLALTSLSAPGSAPAGSEITVNWTGANLGPDATPIPLWAETVVISNDAVLDGSDRVLANTYAAPGLLEPAGTWSNSVKVTVPILPVGNYYLFVSTNSGGAIFENGATANNYRSQTLSVLPVPANLQVEQVGVPAEAVSGQAVQISWSTKNVGTGPTYSSSWYDRVILSQDALLDATDINLGAKNHNGVLGASQSYSAELTTDSPAGIEGEYYAFVIADTTGAVTENDESDNEAISLGKINFKLPPPVDLEAGAVDIPAAAELGEIANLTYRVKNISTNAAIGAWTDVLYLSTDDKWSLDDSEFARVQHLNGLAPGLEYVENVAAEVPAVEPGQYFVVMRTDVRNRVPELREDNNQSASVGKADIQIATIPLGTQRDSTLSSSQNRYYRTDVPDAETIRWDLTGFGPDDWNDLFVRDLQVASALRFDYLGLPFQPSQTVTVPNSKQGFEYANARGTFVVAPNTKFQIKPQVVPFGITSVSTERMGDQGQVTITLNGAKYVEGSIVTLRKSGTVLTATEVEIVSLAKARARFYMNKPPLGDYELRVKLPSGAETTYANPIRIEQATRYWVESQFLSNDPPKVGRPDLVQTTLRNAGNIDLPIATVSWTTGKRVTSVPGLPDRGLPRASALEGIDWLHKNPLAIDFGQFSAGSFVVRDFAPGEAIPFNETFRGFTEGLYPMAVHVSGELPAVAAQRAALTAERLRKVYLTKPLSSVPTYFQNAIGSPTAFWQVVKIALIDAGYFTASELSDANPLQDFGYSFEFSAPSFDVAMQQVATVLADDPDMPQALFGARLMGAPSELAMISFGSGDALGIPRTDDVRAAANNYVPSIPFFVHDRDAQSPIDPNEKTGKRGSGPSRLVGGSQPIDYKISFENAANARGYVGRIEVTDPLPSDLDPRTVTLSEIKVGDFVITVPPNRAFYSGRAILPESMGGLLMDTTAYVDVATATVKWTLQALEPSTAEPPVTGQRGLLGPEDGSGRGKGYVAFAVKPRPGTGSGTIISNRGIIVFDKEPPITTGSTQNTVDAILPSSKVTSFTSQFSIDPNLSVTWSGSDSGGIFLDGDPTQSGLKEFDVFVSTNGGPWQEWIRGTTHTQAIFSGAVGSTYAFYSRASDNAGNVEKPPATADATIQVIAANPPKLTGVSPGGTFAGTSSLTITVKGQDFRNDSVIYFDGAAKATTFVNATTLKTTLLAADMASPGKFGVQVRSLGLTSNTVWFVIGRISITATPSLTRVGSTVEVSVQIANTGTLPASSVRITLAQIGSKATTTTLPISLGSINAGQSKTAKLVFPSAGSAGLKTTFAIQVTHSNGTLNQTTRVTLP